MTGKEKKINFWTTKEIRKKISRARYSKTSLEDEVRVDTSWLPKLSRSCHSTEKTNRAKKDWKKEQNLQNQERKVSIFGSF